jgi:acyl dehydratase
MKYFEDAEIDVVTVFPGRYTLTEENILAMGREWDPIPIHTDREKASATIFGDIVASTVHLFAIATKLSRTAEDEWAVVSSLGMSDLINHSPGYAGDILEADSRRNVNLLPGPAWESSTTSANYVTSMVSACLSLAGRRYTN